MRRCTTHHTACDCREALVAQQLARLRESACQAWTEVIDAHRQWCGRCAPGELRPCGDRAEAEAELLAVQG